MIINVKERGVLPVENVDNTLPLRKILAEIENLQNVTLVFEKGVYLFCGDFATEILMYIPNHDEDTLKRVAFPLIGCEGLCIKGEDTQFIFEGDIIPFYLSKCSDVLISGISIDYRQPVYSQATIVSVGEKQMQIAIDKEKYSYEIINNRLYFPYNGKLVQMFQWLEMDKEFGGPAFGLGDVVFGEENGRLTPFCTEENGIITLCLKEEGQKFSKMSKVGNGLILRHHLRTHPCFYVAYCRDVKFKNIDVYHTLGMAFIAQHTRDIELDRFNVKINPSNPRIFTATADATHFVYCGGEIKINDCLFENQLDDPINVHGIYARIEKVIDEKTIMVQLVHHQQKGVAMGEIGEELQVVDNLTMLSIHKTKIENICSLNKDYILINLSCPCGEMKTGYVVENLAYVPNVTVTNCVFRNNRARGPLLTAGGKILLEKNYFSVAGAAVLIEGDSNLWFESGATKDISILDNVFDNCAYIPDWGQAPIQVTPSTVKASGNERFHKKLVVKNNVFNCFDGRLLYAKHIENIEFTDNKITKTDKFPPVGEERFHLEEVVFFTEKNNG